MSEVPLYMATALVPKPKVALAFVVVACSYLSRSTKAS